MGICFFVWPSSLGFLDQQSVGSGPDISTFVLEQDTSTLLLRPSDGTKNNRSCVLCECTYKNPVHSLLFKEGVCWFDWLQITSHHLVKLYKVLHTCRKNNQRISAPSAPIRWRGFLCKKPRNAEIKSVCKQTCASEAILCVSGLCNICLIHCHHSATALTAASTN